MKDRTKDIIAAVVISALLAIAGALVIDVLQRPKKKMRISERWQRWNESYSPEADEPEPPKYEVVP